MIKIEYSPQALEDLKNLKTYLSINWGEDISEKVLRKITADIRRLALYPNSGVNLGKKIDITTDYYYIFSEKNFVFYRIEFDSVFIVRVLSEKQDYLKQLFEIN